MSSKTPKSFDVCVKASPARGVRVSGSFGLSSKACARPSPLLRRTIARWSSFSTPWGTIVGQTVGNTLEVVVAAVLFRRLTQRRIALERVWDVLALVACAALGTLISAVFGVVSLRLGDVIKADEFGSVFRTWW